MCRCDQDFRPTPMCFVSLTLLAHSEYRLDLSQKQVGALASGDLLLVCVSFTIIGQPRNSILIRSVAEISHHSVLSGDRIRQCETSSGSRYKDTDQCL